jgi:hypothetical protein
MKQARRAGVEPKVRAAPNSAVIFLLFDLLNRRFSGKEWPAAMKQLSVLPIVAALACAVGCQRKETGGKNDPPTSGDILARCHFVGTLALAENMNAAKLKAVWSLPESRRLAEQTFQRLTHAPRTLGGERITPAQDEQGAALLRPMLDDLLRYESFLQVRGPADRTAEWTLLVQLPAERLSVWRASLTSLMTLWTAGTPATNTMEGFAGWEVKRSDSPSVVRCVEAGQWLVLGIGQNNLSAVGEAARRIKAGGRPIAIASNYWLQTELDLPRLRAVFGLPASLTWPHANLTVVGQGESVHSNMRLVFPEPVTGSVDPWQVPTNLIREPLVSFTAVRGISPLLNKCESLQKLELVPGPNEVYLWAQGRKPINRDLPFQTFLAFPLKDASAKLKKAGEQASLLFDTNWRDQGLAQIAWNTNSQQILWKGLPFITPFLAPAKFRDAEFAAGGLFPSSPSSNPPPAELLSQLNVQPRLVYYDWEISEARLHHWRVMSELFAIIARRSQLTTNTAGLPWLTAIEPELGNTVTQITADSPKEWSLVRKSDIGFSGFELVALAHWLEYTNFPAIGFDLPPRPMVRPPVKSQSPATNRAVVPVKKPPGG